MNRKILIFIYFIIFSLLTFCWYFFSFKLEKEVRLKRIDKLNKNEINDMKQIDETIEKSENLYNITFNYLLNNRVCDKGNKEITAVILVTSYYGNVETRSAMRRAFSNEELIGFDMRRVFLIAQPPEWDKSMNPKAILNENKRFGDLVQGNFIEAYRNLTYKHTMGLRWAAKYCSNAKYVIKMDDDIVVDIYKISDYLHKTFKFPKNKQLAGFILQGLMPIREPKNKWYVTKNEYEPSMYPPFLSGWFYVTTPKIAEKLSDLANKSPYFWIDDAFITGIIAKKLKYKLHDIKHIFVTTPKYLHCCMKDLKSSNFNCPAMVGPNGGDNNLFFTYNEVMSKCYLYPCKERPLNKHLDRTCVKEKNESIGRGNALVERVKLF